MTIGFIDKSYKDIALNFYEDHVEPTQFTIFGEAQKMFGKIKIEIYVIGASHLVRVVDFDRAIDVTEVLACEPALEKNNLKLQIPSKDLAPIYGVGKHACAGKNYEYGYNSEITFVPLPKQDNPLQRIPYGDISITCKFPTNGEDRRPAETNRIPFTSVGASVKDNKVIIRSLHWYESEDTMVFSKSEITLGES